jgi:hypothetical protein
MQISKISATKIGGSAKNFGGKYQNDISKFKISTYLPVNRGFGM